MPDRGVAPVLGVVLLVALTVVTAAAVGTVVVVDVPDGTTTATFGLEATADGEVRVLHRGGDTVDPGALRVRIHIDGDPLAEQPPVPFFSARGFESGPTGPFNSAYSGAWTAGQAASLRVASTNEPTPRAGATVEVRLYVDGRQMADLETTVQAASRASVPVGFSASSSGT